MENMSIAEALAKIKVQNERLSEANADLSKWKIGFSFEVDANTFDVKVTALKPHGGGGVIRTVTKEELMRYADDPDTLLREIAEQFYEVLLKEQIFNDLAQHGKRVFANTVMMAQRKQ